ncbi:MAG: hypothetical protein F6K35_19205 [Okeania sp. SIO2H7]|nr:hypothetical protein [Okeania sp. SIO2H7]
MPKDFNYWKKLHDRDTLQEFNYDRQGLLWLKIKSITRRGIISEFATSFNYQLSETSLNKQFVELFNILSSDIEKSHQHLDEYMATKNGETLKKLNVDELVNELYKLKYFDWGGDYQNSLDKYLVSKYVKANKSYNWLNSKLDKEIAEAVRGYVLCSWYNHWSSVLIEHLFKSHELVIPTVGQIKNVDFFILDIPFDLKVTYLPVNFIEKQRKLAGLRPELTFLKQRAREIGIYFQRGDKNLYYQLTEKMKDKADSLCLLTLKELKDFRLNLINNVKDNPRLLAKNLYEEQGEMRFGAENRIFLVLVDKSDFDSSWKLKRNMELLKPKIDKYINSLKLRSIEKLKLSFYKKGNSQQFPTKYEVLTDVLVIEKD